jgi:transposase InsO family protein
MPWREVSVVDERLELCELAVAGTVSFAELCRRFGVSRPTGYRWLRRFQAGGAAGLVDRSTRPLHCPSQTPEEMERLVVGLRKKHPRWGGRKISRRLRDLGHAAVPAPSTVTGILRRHGLVSAEPQRRDHQRFVADEPNDLWQMDFKGHFGLSDGSRCHPLGLLDDHSRYNLALRACGNERTRTVQGILTDAFTRYGLPRRILCDNGPPWGDRGGQPWTPLGVWLLDLGVGVTHSRPYHPQTVGKEERFHQSLDWEVISTRPIWDTMSDIQDAFDTWRVVYNHQRPHDSLDLDVPASRYRPSTRSMPTRIESFDYPDGYQVQTADSGRIWIGGRRHRIPKAFNGRPLGVIPADTDGTYHIRYRHQLITTVTLTQ